MQYNNPDTVELGKNEAGNYFNSDDVDSDIIEPWDLSEMVAVNDIGRVTWSAFLKLDAYGAAIFP